MTYAGYTSTPLRPRNVDRVFGWRGNCLPGESVMRKTAIVVGCVLLVGRLLAQAPQTTANQKPSLPATDVTAADIQKFIDALPKDAISDNPIRIVDAGNQHIGVYGVFRPKNSPQDAILHDVTTSEIYYMLEGSATLVTGG